VIKVLIVDDDDFFAQLLAAMLAGPDVEALVAQDMAQAEAELDESDFDVVFLDVRLPDGNGLESDPGLIKLQNKRIPAAGLFQRFTTNDHERLLAMRLDDFRKPGNCTDAKNYFRQAGKV